MARKGMTAEGEEVSKEDVDLDEITKKVCTLIETPQIQIISSIFNHFLPISCHFLQVAEELDIDMNDPELHKAATKIQASFRGHKSRREDEK